MSHGRRHLPWLMTPPPPITGAPMKMRWERATGGGVNSAKVALMGCGITRRAPHHFLSIVVRAGVLGVSPSFAWGGE